MRKGSRVMQKHERTRLLGSLEDYRTAPSGVGPLAFTWEDKPHRLVYDLIGEVKRLRRIIRVRSHGNIYKQVRTEDGATYTPWTDGWAIGFHVRHDDGREEYVYLNPSGASDDGQNTVFLYQGSHGDPGKDLPVTFVNVL